MPKSIKFIVGGCIIFLIIGGFWLYKVKNQDVLKGASYCTTLSEEKCNADPMCRPSYGSSFCNSEGLCTADIKFFCEDAWFTPIQFEQMQGECTKRKGTFNKEYLCPCYKLDENGDSACLVQDLIDSFGKD